MDIFDLLSLIGGLALFLFGMQVMGSALEKKASGQFKHVLSKITNNPLKGFALGLGITSIIQSSSATTVMVVGFVNSGIMTLHQAIYIIMGANVGTTVTAWILSLTGISGTSFLVQLLKPASFTPVLALIGIIFTMFLKSPRKKETGNILLGFAVLMSGMFAMASAVEGLKDVPAFVNLFTLFSNPLLGVLVGAVLTAIIQSSSASVGILQALSSTGVIPYASAIPIIMGQNIGTCVTAMLSSVGANKNAKRAAFVHLYFNIVGTLVLLTIFTLVRSIVDLPFIHEPASYLGIAVVHSTFNILCTMFLMPFARGLEKLAILTIKEEKTQEQYEMLDERLFSTPSIAVERSRDVTLAMAEISVSSLQQALGLLQNYDAKLALTIRQEEQSVDRYEDKLGSYLVELCARDLSDADSKVATELLHMIGDFERISDHAVNLAESAEEIIEKQINFSDDAKHELAVMSSAVSEILDLALRAFRSNDLETASQVEPLEQVIDTLKEELKSRHIARLQQSQCTIELGFIFSDLLTNLERVADHCSNIAGYLLEIARNGLSIHEYLNTIKGGEVQLFNDRFAQYKTKYSLDA